MEMTTQVFLSLILDMPDEQEIAQLVLDEYSADVVDFNIERLFAIALDRLGFPNIGCLRGMNAELTVYLKSDEERPSLHLTANSVSLLAEAACSFDFDPYCIQNNPDFWIVNKI